MCSKEETPPDDSASSGDSCSGSSASSERDPNLGAAADAGNATDSGTSLTFQPSRCGTPVPGGIPAILLNCSMEDGLRPDAGTGYRKNADTSFARFRLPTPDGSVFGLDWTLETPEEEKRDRWRKNMTILFSCIYGVLLVVTGGIIYVNNQSQDTRYISEMFSACVCAVGMSWLVFFHVDLFRYKRKVVRNTMGSADQMDRISTRTDVLFGMTSFLGNETPPYRFLTGRHSGSFYLKAGLAAFCFGHLINEGLQLGQQILNFALEQRRSMGCGERSALLLHSLRPVYSFYQLFIIFKYSNVIINRHRALARFALMHIMATCLCFWFGTIVEDALEDYHHKLGDIEKQQLNRTVSFTSDDALCSHLTNDTRCACNANSILSINKVQAVPYLYPFTIEFNQLSAGVWFVVWHNIGREHRRANPHPFHHRVRQGSDGLEEVTFHSNLAISADCHSANKGLFAGLFLLVASVLSVIVFFVAMGSPEHRSVGLSVHYLQEGTLTCLTLLGVLLAFGQLSRLDYSRHPVTFLDDVLLFVPLPFYFVQAVLTVLAECRTGKTARIVLAVLVPVQVVLQTPLVVDGLRRCSNARSLRYGKPGRETVTFLLVCNLTLWVINTFEAKSVEFHYGRDAHFGEFLWMFVSHTTLPLILFYRFHSSVCLADIWKSAYEKGD